MGTLAVRVRYRPVRIGWCVRQGNWDQLHYVLRLTHTLWGGRFNPIIPLDDREAARQLIEGFRIDCLASVLDEPKMPEFERQFPWLRWPIFEKQVFVATSGEGSIPTFLDIYHPVRRLFEKFIEHHSGEPKFKTIVPTWETSDPLAAVFSAWFGTYPPKTEIGNDYSELVANGLKADRIHLGLSAGVPGNFLGSGNPSEITKYSLNWDRSPQHGDPGFYIGDANDFEDVVNFWNLRAADIELQFFDPSYADRLGEAREAYTEFLRNRPRSEPGVFGESSAGEIAIWSKDGEARESSLPDVINMPPVRDLPWTAVKPPLHYIDEDESVLASVTEDGDVPMLSLQLPRRPVFERERTFINREHLVVSLSFVSDIDLRGNITTTFHTPFIPELNDFYRAQMWLVGDEARAESSGIGIVTSSDTSSLTLRSLPKRDLVAAIFGCFGMRAESSAAGRIATRLIRQMGGIQGCRVFKIRGVRELIQRYGPLDSFTRSAALQIIGQNDPATGAPRFSDYERLYIEPRDRGPLKPEHAFQFMLKREVFQTGLKLFCPNCELDFWMELGTLASEVKCEYCGSPFNVTPQLKDRDWAFRRSGLFGRENNQEGSIPVVLVLQQLDTILHSRPILVPAMKITSEGAQINECEADFVCVHQDYNERVSVVIGECKSRGEITQEDIDNLGRIADAFPRNRVRVYVLFAKLSAFTPGEVVRCRKAQPLHSRRIIMLSDRELEPYRAYERVDAGRKPRMSVFSLDGMANATHEIYFGETSARAGV